MSICECSVDIGASESFLRGGEQPSLIIQSTGHAVHIFINGQLTGAILDSFSFLAFLFSDYPTDLDSKLFLFV